MKQGGRISRAAAYYVPSDLLSAVEAEVRATEAEREQNRLAAVKARAKAHVRELARVADLIRELFPAILAGKVERVAVHAYEVGSRQVGRTGSLSAEQKVNFAVQGHIRHEYTDYADLLSDGWAMKDARE